MSEQMTNPPLALQSRARERHSSGKRCSDTDMYVTSAAGTPIIASALVSEGFTNALCPLLQQLVKTNSYQIRSKVLSNKSFLACFPPPIISIMKNKRGSKNSFKACESRDWPLENQLSKSTSHTATVVCRIPTLSTIMDNFHTFHPSTLFPFCHLCRWTQEPDGCTPPWSCL